MPKRELRKGDVCRCSQGYMGMITQDGKRRVEYPDGNHGEAYIGIHLSEDKWMEGWSSRNPEFLFSVIQH